MKWRLSIFLLCMAFQVGLAGIEFTTLNQNLQEARSPFNYDLQVKMIKGESENQNVLLLLHGMGGDNTIADILHSYGIPDHLVSFNFPDASYREGFTDPRTTNFGSIKEVLPVLYLLKKLVLDSRETKINMYGFSAGGGALVNVIGVLNTNKYDSELKKIGIGDLEKKTILEALQRGIVILDAPLKSIRELITSRGNSPTLAAFLHNYKKNDFEPLDALKNWQGLKMQVLLYFENPDHVLSNLDDNLFIAAIKKYNSKGNVQVFIGRNGGHLSFHKELWQAYQEKELILR